MYIFFILFIFDINKIYFWYKIVLLMFQFIYVFNLVHSLKKVKMKDNF